MDTEPPSESSVSMESLVDAEDSVAPEDHVHEQADHDDDTAWVDELSDDSLTPEAAEERTPPIALKAHQRRYQKCQDCGKTFRDKCDLRRHQGTHTRQKTKKRTTSGAENTVKKRQYYSVKDKLEYVALARTVDLRQIEREKGIAQKLLRTWIKQEAELKTTKYK